MKKKIEASNLNGKTIINWSIVMKNQCALFATNYLLTIKLVLKTTSRTKHDRFIGTYPHNSCLRTKCFKIWASLQLEVTAQRQSRSHNRSIPHTSRPRSKSLSKILCSNHFKFKNNANKCCIGCTWMDKQNCTITQICVYHDIYASSAKRCLPGCTFTKNWFCLRFKQLFR